MRTARPTLFAVAVAAAAILAAVIAYVVTVQRQDQPAAAAAIRIVPTGTASPRPQDQSPQCACFAAATAAAPTPTTPLIAAHGQGEPDAAQNQSRAQSQGQSAPAARAVAANVVRTAFGYDTRTDGGADAAAQRARRWIAPGALPDVETAAAATTGAATHWHRWAAHQAHARVTLAPVGSVHPNGADRAQTTFRVTIRMHGAHGWSEKSERRVTVRSVHRDGRWLVDRLTLAHAD